MKLPRIATQRMTVSVMEPGPCVAGFNGAQRLPNPDGTLPRAALGAHVPLTKVQTAHAVSAAGSAGEDLSRFGTAATLPPAGSGRP